MNWDLIGTIVVMLWTALADQRRDALNHASYKRPNHRLPWPLLDRWHLWKKAQLYPVCVWTIYLSGMPWPWIAVVAVVALVIWRVLPTPKHWRA